MSENLPILVEAPASTDPSLELDRVRRDERGMVTIEYAVGALMVIALVGVIIASLTTGTFQPVVKDFIEFVMAQVKTIVQAKG